MIISTRSIFMGRLKLKSENTCYHLFLLLFFYQAKKTLYFYLVTTPCLCAYNHFLPTNQQQCHPLALDKLEAKRFFLFPYLILKRLIRFIKSPDIYIISSAWNYPILLHIHFCFAVDANRICFAHSSAVAAFILNFRHS